jgi:UDP-N-acetylmuramate--alanine ligase
MCTQPAKAPVSGGTTADIYAEMKRGTPLLPVSYVPGQAPGRLPGLLRDARPGDLVVFVGAGDIYRCARDWVESARESRERALGWDHLAETMRPVLSPGSKLLREEALAPKTTLRVGGAARLYCEPVNEEDLRHLLSEAATRGVPVSCWAAAPT